MSNCPDNKTRVLNFMMFDTETYTLSFSLKEGTEYCTEY